MKSQEEFKKRMEKSQRIANAIADLRCPDHNVGLKNVQVDAGFRASSDKPCCDKFNEFVQIELFRMVKDQKD